MCSPQGRENKLPPLQEPQHVLFLFGKEQGVGKEGITFHSDKTNKHGLSFAFIFPWDMKQKKLLILKN